MKAIGEQFLILLEDIVVAHEPHFSLDEKWY